MHVRPSQIRRVVLCAGRVYYDIAAERATRGIDDVAIVRVEQVQLTKQSIFWYKFAWSRPDLYQGSV